MNKQEIKQIIDKQEISDIEVIAVIEQYIFDRKGVNIKINRPIGSPCLSLFHTTGRIITDFNLMWEMYLTCIEYYGKEE